MCELAARGVSVDWTVSLGAKSEGIREPVGKVIDWKPDLPVWIGEYDVVVSEAGFNTVMELLSVGLPALLIPGHRRIDNQELRAVNYELEGCGICCFPEEGGKRLADAFCRLLDCRDMLLAADTNIALSRKLCQYPSLEQVIGGYSRGSSNG